jgi:hypothetical protein
VYNTLFIYKQFLLPALHKNTCIASFLTLISRKAACGAASYKIKLDSALDYKFPLSTIGFFAKIESFL